jgi:hypothetical protein
MLIRPLMGICWSKMKRALVVLGECLVEEPKHADFYRLGPRDKPALICALSSPAVTSVLPSRHGNGPTPTDQQVIVELPDSICALSPSAVTSVSPSRHGSLEATDPPHSPQVIVELPDSICALSPPAVTSVLPTDPPHVIQKPRPAKLVKLLS